MPFRRSLSVTPEFAQILPGGGARLCDINHPTTSPNEETLMRSPQPLSKRRKFWITSARPLLQVPDKSCGLNGSTQH